MQKKRHFHVKTRPRRLLPDERFGYAAITVTLGESVLVFSASLLAAVLIKRLHWATTRSPGATVATLSTYGTSDSSTPSSLLRARRPTNRFCCRHTALYQSLAVSSHLYVALSSSVNSSFSTKDVGFLLPLNRMLLPRSSPWCNV